MTSGWQTSAEPSRPPASTNSQRRPHLRCRPLRLIVIGEAVKRVTPNVLAAEPDIPYEAIAGRWERLVHRCFDASHAILRATSIAICRFWRPELKACEGCRCQDSQDAEGAQGPRFAELGSTIPFQHLWTVPGSPDRTSYGAWL
jgi:hypothetical protein